MTPRARWPNQVRRIAVPEWLRNYRRQQAVPDGIAGEVVTVLLIPQSLSCATGRAATAYGLYASILPLLAYAAFGSSMTLVLRLGFVANLLSHPVVSGFVTGSALLIAIGQLKPLLDIPAHGHTSVGLLYSLRESFRQLQPFTAVLGRFQVQT